MPAATMAAATSASPRALLGRCDANDGGLHQDQRQPVGRAARGAQRDERPGILGPGRGGQREHADQGRQHQAPSQVESLGQRRAQRLGQCQRGHERSDRQARHHGGRQRHVERTDLAGEYREERPQQLFGQRHQKDGQAQQRQLRRDGGGHCRGLGAVALPVARSLQQLRAALCGVAVMGLGRVARNRVPALPAALHALPAPGLGVGGQRVQQRLAPQAARQLAHQHCSDHQGQHQIEQHAAQLAVHVVGRVAHHDPPAIGRDVDCALGEVLLALSPLARGHIVAPGGVRGGGIALAQRQVAQLRRFGQLLLEKLVHAVQLAPWHACGERTGHLAGQGAGHGVGVVLDLLGDEGAGGFARDPHHGGGRCHPRQQQCQPQGLAVALGARAVRTVRTGGSVRAMDPVGAGRGVRFHGATGAMAAALQRLDHAGAPADQRPPGQEQRADNEGQRLEHHAGGGMVGLLPHDGGVQRRPDGGGRRTRRIEHDRAHEDAPARGAHAGGWSGPPVRSGAFQRPSMAVRKVSSPALATGSPRSVSTKTARSALSSDCMRCKRSTREVWSATATPNCMPRSASSATCCKSRTTRSCDNWVSSCSVRQAISTSESPNSASEKIAANTSDSRRRRGAAPRDRRTRQGSARRLL